MSNFVLDPLLFHEVFAFMNKTDVFSFLDFLEDLEKRNLKVYDIFVVNVIEQKVFEEEEK